MRTRTAEVLDYDAGEECEGVEVGFGFRDGYDEVAASGEAAIDESTSDGVEATVAVEVDFGQIAGCEIGTTCEHESAGILVVVDLCSPFSGATPVPDGQGGIAGTAGPR